MNSCTFIKTRDRYYNQYWKRCLDCFPDVNTGACLNCIAVCHDGHNIDNTLRLSNFYCDCGKKGLPTCKLSSYMEEPTKIVHPVPRPLLTQPPTPPLYRPGNPVGVYMQTNNLSIENGSCDCISSTVNNISNDLQNNTTEFDRYAELCRNSFKYSN